MDVAVSTSHLYAEGSLMENTSAEMSPAARQANAGKLGGRKSDNGLAGIALGGWGAPTRLGHEALHNVY